MIEVASGKQRPALEALTSLRFFAAFYVVLFHGARGYIGDSDIAQRFVGNGFIAVDLFFVLSGFILAYRYATPSDDMNSSKRTFFAARFARIYPVYVLSLVLGAPIYLQELHTKHGMGSMLMLAALAGLASLALCQAWVYRIATAWNTPAWSLSVETFLYATFPVLMPRLAKRARRGSPLVLAATVWVIAMCVPTLYFLVRHSWSVAAGDVPHIGFLRFFPLFHLPAFLLGIIAGWMHLNRRGPTPAFVLPLVTVAIFAGLCFGDWSAYPLLHSPLFAPLFATLIYALAGSSGVAVRALSVKPLVLLGEASYALYLLHVIALDYARRTFGDELSLGQFVAVIAVLQLICIGIFMYVETPLRRRLMRAIGGKRPEGHAAP